VPLLRFLIPLLHAACNSVAQKTGDGVEKTAKHDSKRIQLPFRLRSDKHAENSVPSYTYDMKLL
jgi:hypothetical protein